MQIGFIGLGKMGLGMVTRLVQKKHKIIVYAPHLSSVKRAKNKGAIGSTSLEDLVNKLKAPRIIWLMVPAGQPTAEVIDKLALLLCDGDVIIDGGNSFYKDSMLTAARLSKRGIHFLDVGTSGGIWGLKDGYCLMVGGEKKIFQKVEFLLKALSIKNGYAYVGKSGVGHFVKMVHNGIEYALLQAYGEGFAIMQAKEIFAINLEQVADIWNHGSVIRSWLLELTNQVFSRDPNLSSVEGYIEDSGEGRWSVAEALALDVPAPVITISLLERLQSRLRGSFSAKLIASLRNKFGGHLVNK